ncbi:UDP-glucose-4-epimerase [Mycobacterium tuberculosis]|nr:UDP-glucose-4-epimerase [Mycobacterium tuberculosis]CNM99199.1 UDP-glucose-4-epimerase [Mycobacterium tuberculosis]
MPKISSRDGGRPAQRTVNPIIVTRRGKIARLESGLTPRRPRSKIWSFCERC